MAKRKKGRPSGPVRFSAWITLPSGRVIFARDYGLRAFPIGSRKRK